MEKWINIDTLKWVNTDNFGDLFIEQELARLDIPFIFVCLDKDNTKYLAICYDDKDYKYILAKCDNQSLIQILKREVAIDAFIKQSDKLLLVDLIDWDKAIIKEVSFNDLDNDILINKDTFFEVENKAIDAYLEKLINSNN